MIHLTAADHARVSATVRDAEARTNGEIVTIATDFSDSYHDVGLHYAVLAMLSLLAVVAIWPRWFGDVVIALSGGWDASIEPWFGIAALLIVQIIVFLIVRYALAWMPLRMALTPPSTRRRRVRRRAIASFKIGTEARTEGRTGVLIYLSMGEHMAEIVADEAIHGIVEPAVWGEAMVALIDAVKDDRPGDGIVAAVEQVGGVLAKHFPRSAGDVNEVPDRLIVL